MLEPCTVNGWYLYLRRFIGPTASQLAVEFEERWDRTVSASDDAAMERRDEDRLRARVLLAAESISSPLNFCKFFSESSSLGGGLLRSCFSACSPFDSSASASESSRERFRLVRAG